MPDFVFNRENKKIFPPNKNNSNSSRFHLTLRVNFLLNASGLVHFQKHNYKIYRAVCTNERNFMFCDDKPTKKF